MRRTGTTLLELVVAIGLLGVVTFLLMQLFLPSMWMFNRQQSNSESFQNSMFLTQRLQIELTHSCWETVTLVQNQPAAGVAWALSLRPVLRYAASSGNPIVEERFLVYFHNPEQKKVYFFPWVPVVPAGEEFPLKLTPAALSAACLNSQNVRERRMLTRYVSEFSFTDRDGSLTILDPPLQFHLVVQVPDANNRGVETTTTDIPLQCRNVRW
ncbi:MAG: hypothetical protein KF760_23915 [Candidatus Eremiobacteraeota bacterium]|nr:hypothetical protein [Candidatus Eremiobacteraeota bacterium]MCW5866600.1 hypothetical protein [Candidatus Eremiobacteraeota bacterium]